jgi:hypothetical protein
MATDHRCTHGCGADWRPVYRKKSGVSTWTGITASPDRSTFKKLDDPRGELDGPGHAMDPNEFVSEMQQYDGSHPIAKPVDVWDGAPLAENDSEKSNFQAEPPFVTDSGVWHIRSDDRVKVAIRGEKLNEEGVSYATRERVWMHVVSVTVFGVVTAVPLSQLKWSPVGPHEPVFFHGDAVFGLKRGSNW